MAYTHIKNIFLAFPPGGELEMACVTLEIYSPGRSSPVAGQGRGALAARCLPETQDIAILCSSTTPVPALLHSVKCLRLAERFSECITSSGWQGRSHGW